MSKKNFREDEIQKMMRKLDLSREEAIQLLQDDEDDVTEELSAEQEAVAKEMSKTTALEKKPKKRGERKADDEKRHIMHLLDIAIGYNPDVTDYQTVNPEREVMFRYNGTLYRLTLMKPREKKGE
jgi:hypothetical protein